MLSIYPKRTETSHSNLIVDLSYTEDVDSFSYFVLGPMDFISYNDLFIMPKERLQDKIIYGKTT